MPEKSTDVDFRLDGTKHHLVFRFSRAVSYRVGQVLKEEVNTRWYEVTDLNPPTIMEIRLEPRMLPISGHQILVTEVRHFTEK